MTNILPITNAGKIAIICDLLVGSYDELGNFIPPLLELTDEEIMELLNG